MRRVPGDWKQRERFCGCLTGVFVPEVLWPGESSVARQTQMTLRTADGMLRGWVRFRLKGLGPVFESTVANAYRRPPAVAGARDAVSRVAPAGMLLSHWLAGDATMAARTLQLGAAIAGLTDALAEERQCAGAYALLIARLMRGETLPEALQAVKSALLADSGYGEALAAVEVGEASETLPGGAFAAAIHCALGAPDFQSGVLLAASHADDPAATVSMTGALLGARFGRGAIPPRWLTGPGLRAAIEALADDLATAPEWAVGGFRETGESRYYIGRYPPN